MSWLLPYRGEMLHGDALQRQLDAWVAAGTIEPSCAEAVREVAANPDWLDLSDQRLVVLGAGAEMGPLPVLLGWGGEVVGVDLPRPELWQRLTAVADAGAGRLIAPASPRGTGADLLSEPAAIADWLLGIEGRLILGNYVYAPGAAYVRLAAAVDALGMHLAAPRRRGAGGRWPPRPTCSPCRPRRSPRPPPGIGAAAAFPDDPCVLRRAAAAAQLSGRRPGRPGISDSLVAQQGPNYALAKRIHRWRASVGRRDGVVSFAVAPPTRTRSVLSNRLLAAAYAAAHLFDVEVFAPATANRLMAALLVHQIRRRGRRRRPPGGTRPSPPSTVDCGGPRTGRAARSGWPRSAG